MGAKQRELYSTLQELRAKTSLPCVRETLRTGESFESKRLQETIKAMEATGATAPPGFNFILN